MRTPLLDALAAEPETIEELINSTIAVPYNSLLVSKRRTGRETGACRLVEAVTGAEAAVDPSCPCCQMMADDVGPYFWNLDGCNMDDEFAFSFCQTRDEWEREQAKWEEFDRDLLCAKRLCGRSPMQRSSIESSRRR